MELLRQKTKEREAREAETEKTNQLLEQQKEKE